MRVGIFVDSLLEGPLSVKKYLTSLLYEFMYMSLHKVEFVLLLRKTIVDRPSFLLKRFKNVEVSGSLEAIKNVDILHIPDCGRQAPQIELLRKARHLNIPIIVTNHGMANIALHPNIVFGKSLTITLLNSMKELLKWRIVKYFLNIVITPSISEKHLVSKAINLSPERIVAIYHGVNHKLYKPIDKNKSREFLATKYGVVNEFILHVSIYQPKKNVERIIIAYAMLKKKIGIKEKLVIVGKHPKEKLLELSAKLGIEPRDIVFVGVVPEEDLPYFYSAAKVFVFPSLHESFGMPILEAMASECPVVTSNVFALSEIAGNAAILVNPYDIKEIAKAIYDVITDEELRKELVKLGLKRARNFTWEKCAREHLNVYLRVYQDDVR